MSKLQFTGSITKIAQAKSDVGTSSSGVNITLTKLEPKETSVVIPYGYETPPVVLRVPRDTKLPPFGAKVLLTVEVIEPGK